MSAGPTPATARERTSFIGMAVFLGGWTMLFATLLFVWADVRLSSPVWPPDGEPRAPLVYPAVATLIIGASSWLLARGRVAAAVAAGAGFLAVQAAGLAALWRAGVTPSSGRYGSLLYTFLALHGLHVVVGLAGLVLARAAQPNWRRFWHFVGAVWLVLFAALYLGGCADEHTRGRVAYQQYCRPCHGDAGDGRGFSSPGLRPPPRDFTQALFKFGHTIPLGSLPPDAELARIIRHGLNGTAMRPLDLSDGELRDVIAYLESFSPRWKTEPRGEAVVPTPDPFAAAPESKALELGTATFKKMECGKCHDPGKRELKVSEFCVRMKPGGKTIDDCAVFYRQLPPDLRCDPLRTIFPSTELVDLYRIIGSGIGGSGMPTWKGALKEDELWSLAHYVRALRRDQTGCNVSRTGQ